MRSTSPACSATVVAFVEASDSTSTFKSAASSRRCAFSVSSCQLTVPNLSTPTVTDWRAEAPCGDAIRTIIRAINPPTKSLRLRLRRAWFPGGRDMLCRDQNRWVSPRDTFIARRERARRTNVVKGASPSGVMIGSGARAAQAAQLEVWRCFRHPSKFVFGVWTRRKWSRK